MKAAFFLLLVSTTCLAELKAGNKITFGTSEEDDQPKVIQFGKQEISPRISVDPKEGKLKFTNDGTHELLLGENYQYSRLNLIKNHDFRLGLTGWKGSSNADQKLSDGIFSKTSLKLISKDDSAAYLETEFLDIPNGLKGNACAARIFYRNTSRGLSKLQVINEKDEIISEQNLLPSSAVLEARTYFGCPTSQRIKMRILVSDGTLELDRAHLGEPEDSYTIDQPGFYASINFQNCTWRFNGTSSVVPENTNCDPPTLSGMAAWNGKKTPEITFKGMAPGIYSIAVEGSLVDKKPDPKNTGPSFCSASLVDETGETVANQTHSGRLQLKPSPIFVNGDFTLAEKKDKTFSIKTTALDAAGVCDLSPISNRFTLQVYRFPSQAQKVFTPTQTGWRVEAMLSGDNTQLSASTVNPLDWTGISISNATLTQSPGSIDVTLPCEKKSAKQCDGNPGVSFIPITSGDLRVCTSFVHSIQMSGTNNSLTLFKLAETEKPLTLGVNIVYREISQSEARSISLCSTFHANANERKTIQLMYIQQTSGQIQESLLVLKNSIKGAGMSWEVSPLNQSVALPVFSGSVVNSTTGVSKLEAATLEWNGSNYNVRQQGDWITKAEQMGASPGLLNIYFKDQTFSLIPICSITALPFQDSPVIANILGQTNSYLTLKTWSPDSKMIGSGINLLCIGLR